MIAYALIHYVLLIARAQGGAARKVCISDLSHEYNYLNL